MEVSFYLSKVFIVMSLLPFSLKQDFITQWNSMPTPPTPTSSPNHYIRLVGGNILLAGTHNPKFHYGN